MEGRGRHEQPPEQHLPRRPGGHGADQAAGAGIPLAAGQQRGHAGGVLEGGEGVLTVGHHGELPHPPEHAGQPLQGGRGVDPDGAAVTDQFEQLGRDPVLGPGMAAEPLGEGLRSDRHRAAADALHQTLVGQSVEVAPDRHLAHRQVDGQFGDLDPPGGPDTGGDLLQPVHRLDAHRPDPSSRWDRAAATSA
jgi:hypothetical protein